MSGLVVPATVVAKDQRPYISDIPDPSLPSAVRNPDEWTLVGLLERSFLPDWDHLKDPPDSLCEMLKRDVSINVGYTTALKRTKQSAEDETSKLLRKQLFTETFSFTALSPYYLRFTTYQYPEDKYQQGFEPDFSYSFGVANYAPDTLSLEYANYGGNRFNPDVGEELTDLNAGTITATYRFLVPEDITRAIHPKDDAVIAGWASFNATPEWELGKWWKQWFSLGVSFPVYKDLSFWMQTNVYPIDDQEGQGDTEFVYGFGYYDWGPGGVILSYSNYASNSFPWGKSNKKGDFSDGSVFIGYNVDFDTLCDWFSGKKKKKKPSMKRFPWGPSRKDWGA
ncbi:MAG: hypothetical protein ACNI27_06650 [Desulfovibrio sp.]